MTGKRVCAALAAVFLLLAGGWALLEKMGENRILFPPAISGEILLAREEVGAELLLEKRGTGVYKYICRYTLGGDGHVSLLARDDWQSYEDVVAKAEYDFLCGLSPQRLVEISHMDSGFLAVYDGETGYTILETDGMERVLFAYEKQGDTNFSGAAVSKTQLCILAYEQERDFLRVTVVDKASGAEEVFELSCADLGLTETWRRMGNFLWESFRFRLVGDVLCYAQTHYQPPSAAVIGAYDLRRGEALAVYEFDDAEVVNAYWEAETVRVLVNRGNDAPLELHTFSLEKLEPLGMVALMLPDEALAGKDRGFLNRGELTAERVALLLGDHTAPVDEGKGNCILAVYDGATGELLSKVRLTFDGDYEIYGARLNDQ